MFVYLLNFFLIMVISIIGTQYNDNKNEGALQGYNTNNISMFFVFLLLFSVSAIRKNVGTDYINYEIIFMNIGEMTFVNALKRNNEILFNISVWIIMKITNNTQFVFAFFSLVTIGVFITSIRDYSCSFPISIYLYITSMAYYSSFNGVRQWVASAIIFYGYRYLVNDNKIKYFIIVIIASLFHSSSIIMIPVYLVVRRRSFSILNLLLFIIFFSLVIFFDSFIDILVSILKFTSYSNYDLWFKFNKRGANALRVIIAVIPIILSALYYKNLYVVREDIDYLINISFLNFLFIFLATKNWIFSRFSMFFSVYNVILIPEFLRNSNRGMRRILLYLIIVLYFLLMFLLLPRESDLLPYKTFFNYI